MTLNFGEKEATQERLVSVSYHVHTISLLQQDSKQISCNLIIMDALPKATVIILHESSIHEDFDLT